MKRLTEKRESGAWPKKEWAYNTIAECLDRLAAIEDILGDDYELEQIQGVFDEWHHYLKFAGERNAIESTVSDIYDNGNIDWNRLRELIKADREGRCVMLPCKKGDTVWRIVYDATPHITKDRCTNIKVENREVWVNLIGDRVMGGWNFGKLLFLNEKEAEAALKERK